MSKTANSQSFRTQIAQRTQMHVAVQFASDNDANLCVLCALCVRITSRDARKNSVISSKFMLIIIVN